MFIGITFPFFGGLLGFFGGFAFAPTTYFVSHNFSPWPFSLFFSKYLSQQTQKRNLSKGSFTKKLEYLPTDPSRFILLPQIPCVIWLLMYKPKRFGLSWCTNWVKFLDNAFICSVLCFFIQILHIQVELTFSVHFRFQICIILGVLLTVLSPIGGLRNIILQAKNYHFYS